jgi:hypothetical protein
MVLPFGTIRHCFGLCHENSGLRYMNKMLKKTADRGKGLF